MFFRLLILFLVFAFLQVSFFSSFHLSFLFLPVAIFTLIFFLKFWEICLIIFWSGWLMDFFTLSSLGSNFLVLALGVGGVYFFRFLVNIRKDIAIFVFYPFFVLGYLFFKNELLTISHVIMVIVINLPILSLLVLALLYLKPVLEEER